MTLVHALVSVFVGWVLLSGAMFLLQPSMLFFPMASLEQTPRDWGLEYEDVAFDTEDGLTLHGWYLPRKGATRVLLFFHGNAGNISHRGESIAIFHRLGLDVLIVDYRGFGHSQGSTSEKGLYRDAIASWRWLTEQRGYSAGAVILFGRSLGGVVAAQLASQVQPLGLILESSFSSARDTARALFPLLSRLVPLRYELDAAQYVKRATCPILVLHSPEDDVIPYRLGRKLFDAAPNPKRFVDLRGGHNDGFLLSQPGYARSLAEFLATLPSDGPDPTADEGR